jgi:protein TonB
MVGTAAAPVVVIASPLAESVSDSHAAADSLIGIVPDSALRFSVDRRVGVKRCGGLPVFALSGVAHAALLALALVVLPRATELPAGGEAAIPVEILLVAPDNLDAAPAEAGPRLPEAEVNIPLPEPVPMQVDLALPDMQIEPPQEPSAPLVQVEPVPPPPEAPISPAEAEPRPPEPVALVPEPVVPEPIEPKPITAEVAVPQPAPPPVVVDPQPARQQAIARESKQAAVDESRKVALAKQREAPRQAEATERRERQEQAQRTLAEQRRRAAVQAERQRATPAPVQAAALGRGDAGSGAERRAQQSRQAGGATGGAAPTAGAAEVASYRSRVLAHLARFKNYPESAQDAGIQGRATVSFTITRSGGVTSVALAGSSGTGILDQATLAMVRRAQPFPAMPAGGPASMSFNAVIRYDLR